VGIRLAPLCPSNEKAFEKSTEGTVLGIRFHTKNLTWTLPIKKRDKIVTAASVGLAGNPVTLEDMQILMGLLNDLAQMLPFLRGFRYGLNKFLARLLVPGAVATVLPSQAVKELRVWTLAADTAALGLPIPHRRPQPSLAAVTFVSDAAGAKFVRINGRFIPYGQQGDRGAASINALEDGPIWFCACVTWPTSLLLHARDSADHAYGCKSPTLEAIALALPFLCCPETLVGKEVLLLTDNEPVVYGWESRSIANDESASIIIRAVHLISTYLGCWVTVRHLPRMSSPSAILADSLTRKSTTSDAVRLAVREAVPRQVPQPLTDWLHNPTEDWELPARLLESVKTRIMLL
jgi:hypothetical protein